MKIENNILIIDEEISDEEIEEFSISISQDGVNKIHVKNPNLGASIVQALLIKQKDIEIEVDDEILTKVFENVVYKKIQ